MSAGKRLARCFGVCDAAAAGAITFRPCRLHRVVSKRVTVTAKAAVDVDMRGFNKCAAAAASVIASRPAPSQTAGQTEIAREKEMRGTARVAAAFGLNASSPTPSCTAQSACTSVAAELPQQ